MVDNWASTEKAAGLATWEPKKQRRGDALGHQKTSKTQKSDWEPMATKSEP